MIQEQLPFSTDGYTGVSSCSLFLWVPVAPGLCVHVCVLLWTCLAVPLLLFPAASKVTAWTLPSCNQEELPGEPQASVSSESDLRLWSLRVA